jgi:hypothetical protein
LRGIVFDSQVVPELVEMYKGPLFVAARMSFPSAEQAIEGQLLEKVLIGFHVCEKAVFAATNAAHK